MNSRHRGPLFNFGGITTQYPDSKENSQPHLPEQDGDDPDEVPLIRSKRGSTKPRQTEERLTAAAAATPERARQSVSDKNHDEDKGRPRKRRRSSVWEEEDLPTSFIDNQSSNGNGNGHGGEGSEVKEHEDVPDSPEMITRRRAVPTRQTNLTPPSSLASIPSASSLGEHEEEQEAVRRHDSRGHRDSGSRFIVAREGDWTHTKSEPSFFLTSSFFLFLIPVSLLAWVIEIGRKVLEEEDLLLDDNKLGTAGQNHRKVSRFETGKDSEGSTSVLEKGEMRTKTKRTAAVVMSRAQVGGEEGHDDEEVKRRGRLVPEPEWSSPSATPARDDDTDDIIDLTAEGSLKKTLGANRRCVRVFFLFFETYW